MVSLVMILYSLLFCYYCLFSNVKDYGGLIIYKFGNLALFHCPFKQFDSILNTQFMFMTEPKCFPFIGLYLTNPSIEHIKIPIEHFNCSKLTILKPIKRCWIFCKHIWIVFCMYNYRRLHHMFLSVP